MPLTLVVITSFGGHAAGDRITDPQEIAEALSDGRAAHVVKTDHGDVHQAPAKTKTPKE